MRRTARAFRAKQHATARWRGVLRAGDSESALDGATVALHGDFEGGRARPGRFYGRRYRLNEMEPKWIAFLGVAALLTVRPRPDMALIAPGVRIAIERR